MSKIKDASGNDIVRQVPKVKAAKPTGSLVLLELLSAQEVLGTSLDLGSAKPGSPQAYVLDVGPALKLENYGFRVGDRVLAVGDFNPLPEIEGERLQAIVEPYVIRAVLVEENE